MSDDEYRAHKLKRREQTRDYDIERWYETIRPLTFPTAFVEIRPEEATAMIASYGERYLSRRKPTSDEAACVVRVSEKVQTMMDRTGSSQDGFFVRLSTRSPKDAAMPTRDEYEREAARRADEDEPEDMDAACNCQMRAFFEVGMQALRVRDAAAAMELLLSSERVHTDLQDALVADALGEIKVAIRAWEPRLRQEFEFRAFVREGTLTAISQYNPYCCYPEQVAARDELCATIEEYWRMPAESSNPGPARPAPKSAAEPHTSSTPRAVAAHKFGPRAGTGTAVAPLLAPCYASYVVDVAILAGGECRVIELNPYEPQTGGGLFNWKDPDDLALLERGPLTLRLATQPRPRLQATLEVFISELPVHFTS